MKELVQTIATALVDNPDKVETTETVENGETKILLHVADEDMGKVIGKQGKIARAIRTVTKAAAARDNIRVNVEIK
ncbi:MAG: KH domain-containing protein [Catonella sp.]|jgi:predicted RNA-binding protein YlqC (UPF0109 family)|nr:KH domain-containing protein [Catonella sp.]MDY6355970.1 KH domain-containing protein [Catonella sp.]